jgi:hypothetical protein
MVSDNIIQWKKATSGVFWGEIAPCDHVVQVYENDDVFIDSLSGFVGSGINGGDSIIVIATKAHLNALENKLTSFGIHISTLITDNRYFPLDAETVLATFMVDGWPDEQLFIKVVGGILKKAKQKNCRIRAFGEMVAILWAQGLNGATIHLEHLWNKMAEQEEFSLFCAYPKTGFTADIKDSVHNICCAHSKIINGSVSSMTEVVYKTT